MTIHQVDGGEMLHRKCNDLPGCKAFVLINRGDKKGQVCNHITIEGFFSINFQDLFQRKEMLQNDQTQASRNTC